jgi:hypothetical protein
MLLESYDDIDESLVGDKIKEMGWSKKQALEPDNLN